MFSAARVSSQPTLLFVWCAMRSACIDWVSPASGLHPLHAGRHHSVVKVDGSRIPSGACCALLEEFFDAQSQTTVASAVRLSNSPCGQQIGRIRRTKTRAYFSGAVTPAGEPGILLSEGTCSSIWGLCVYVLCGHGISLQVQRVVGLSSLSQAEAAEAEQ
eukprot:1354123-Amphidinium_carterae.1